jgi:hypothetical protein
VLFRPGAGKAACEEVGTWAAKIKAKWNAVICIEWSKLVETRIMKKLTILLLSFFFLAAHAQKNTEPQLSTRIMEYLLHTKNLAFDKAMDYTHPRLFAIVPREQLVEIMEQAFHNGQMKFSFDTMAVSAISPDYKFGNATYRKVDYHMSMTIVLDDSTDLKNSQMAAAMQQSFETAFPKKKITIDAAKNAIRVAGKDIMFAIKDKQAPDWKFLGYDRSNPALLSQLYPKQVRQYFKLL